MKIHLRQIPEDGLHLEGEEDAKGLDLPADEHLCLLGPLCYSLDIGISGDGFWVTGQLSLDLELECVRCLEKFPYTVEVSDLALQEDLPPQESIDLTPYLREDILLALPDYPHCDGSGERVCPGRQAAKGETAVSAEETDGPTHAPSAWEVLDQIRKSAN